MAQTIFSRQTTKRIQEELHLLRSFIIGMIGKDREGAYHPKFVRRVQKSLQEKPSHVFQNEKSFLKDIRA